MTCCLHTWRDYRRYGYITNRARKLTRYFTGVYIMRSLVRYRVEHAKIKFISTCGHVISFISTECDAALVTFRYPTAVGPFWKLVVSFTGQIEISFLLGFNSNVPMSIHSLDFFIRCSPPSPSPPTLPPPPWPLPTGNNARFREACKTCKIRWKNTTLFNHGYAVRLNDLGNLKKAYSRSPTVDVNSTRL